MKQSEKGIALITGANSGIGLETVRQLSIKAYGKIILACRTEEKAEIVRKKMIDEGFEHNYFPLAIDVAEMKSSFSAVEKLMQKGDQIDLLILNACVSPAKLETNSQGMELTFSSALLGHHILTKGLLSSGLLSTHARIVVSGSEAARGDVPGMSLPDIDNLVKQKFDGNVYEALKSFIFPNSSKKYSPMKTYAIVKLFASLWASSLSTKISNGMVVNSISPGATPDTNLMRHQSLIMRKVMMPMMKVIGPIIGMAGSLEAAALRYLQILDFNSSTNGKFWVSKKGKMIGHLSVFSSTYLDNKSYQDNIWQILEDFIAKERA